MRVIRTVLLIVFMSALVLAAQAAEWQTTIVDPVGGGKFSSLRVDSHGNAHVVYLDEVNIMVKYAFWDHALNKWFTTALDKSGGFCSLVLDKKQRPHISYLEWGGGKVKYAFWDGANWQKQTVEVNSKLINFYTSIALDANNLPNISFYEYFNAEGDNPIRLRTVSLNGKYWEVRTVDPTPGSGKFNSIASDSAGHFGLAYANVKYENASMRYAYWNGQSWESEFVEGQGGTGYGAYSTILVFDKKDIPHIAYTDATKRLVKYAVRRGASWQIEAVDLLVKFDFPDRNGLALDDQGRPYISYFDAGSGVLKVAYKKGNVWVNEIVDQNFAGYTSSIQIDHNTVWVTYADPSGGLKAARRSIEPPDAATQPSSVSLKR